MEKATENRPFEIRTRTWEDWPSSLLEDSVQGEWHYIPIPAIILEIRKTPFISVTESEDGINIRDLLFGKPFNGPDYYLLSGRRPDWHSNHDVLEEPEVVRKVLHATECSGKSTTFSEPRYIEYGSIGLYTPEHLPLMASDVLSAVGVVNSLAISVTELARVYLKDKR